MSQVEGIQVPNVKFREWKKKTIVEFHRSKDCIDKFPLGFGSDKAQALLSAIKTNGIETVLTILEQLAEEKKRESE